MGPTCRLGSICFALLGLLWAPAAAAGLSPLEGPYKVVEVIDGDTVSLADGRQVRFVGIQAPKLSLGRAAIKDWPMAETAKARVVSLLLGQSLWISFGGRQMDRHGRLLAHVFLPPPSNQRQSGDTSSLDEEGGPPPDWVWLQGLLLAEGLARVYSFADNRTRIAEMLALEEGAREKRKGIWRLGFYEIVKAEAAGAALDRFALVEGRVVVAAEVRGRGYLNFGEDWRQDFTLSIDPKVLKRLKAEGFDLKFYEGRRVRARGWIKSFNGPMISLTHPEQIELLPE